MKIAVIVDQFPRISETFVLSHITGLIDRGHDVDIFAWDVGRLDVLHGDVERYKLMSRLSLLAPPEGVLRRVTSAAWLLLRSGYRRPVRQSLNIRRFGRLAGSLRLLHQVANLVNGYDILHCHFGPNGEVVSRLKCLGVPGKLVTTFHGYDIRLGEAQGGEIYRNLFELGDALIAISPYNRRSLLHFGADATRLVTLPLGVDAQQQRLCTPRQSADAPLSLLSVARLVPEKSVDSGLQAVARLKQARPHLRLRYEIVGDGPHRGMLEARIAELGLQSEVVLVGAQNQDYVRDALSRSHFFILPSVAEALPICLMEALGAGLAVVATDVGSIEEIILDGRTGFLVPSGDIEAMAERLTRLADDPARAAAFGRAGRSHVLSTFNHDRQLDALVHLYRELLRNGDRPDVSPAAARELFPA
jgi:colanic acid/amylovoran biosynthesis glycosyltransferase